MTDDKKQTPEQEELEIELTPFTPREKRVLAFICVVIIGLGLAAGKLISTLKIEPVKVERETVVQLVETKIIQKSNQRVIVPAMGNVEAAIAVTLMPEVSGNIIDVNPQFLPGGRFKKGDLILKIDPKNYEFDLIKKEAAVKKAEAALVLEKGNQDVAKHEWKLLGSDKITEEVDKKLALRMPQLMEALAALNSAKADYDLAKANLDRTEIKAPFNAMIQETKANLGKHVLTSTELATLVGTDAYWVKVTLPVNALKFIDFNNRIKQGDVMARIKTKSGSFIKGRVLKLLGDLENKGKMARMIIEVKDIFPKDEIDSDGNAKVSSARLLLGDYVSVEIEGIEIGNIFVLPRTALHDDDVVYVMNKDNKLDLIKPAIIWKGKNEVYVRGLDENAHIITSDLAVAVQGMTLREASLQNDRSQKP